MTSTATLSIYVVLVFGPVDMCRTDGASRANITAVDPDEEPYGGPFSFRLLDDPKGNWRFEPKQGELAV